jgi:type III restriction enzyme
LETYARETDNPIVKPFLLVIARDTAHAKQLMQLIQSESFFEGRYQTKVIQVDSSKTGAEEDEMVQRLLAVESTEEPTEIVIHVNMLKEGWDVTNLYTIVPLRAANARILIEQSIGRGLRLPYGKRTGVAAVDRLNIVAHDKFQEIIDEANRPESPIRLQQVILDPSADRQKTVTVVARSNIADQLISSLPLSQKGETRSVGGFIAPPPQLLFTNDTERKVAQEAYKIIKDYERLPSSTYLLHEEVQQEIVARVAEALAPAQLALAGVSEQPKIAEIVQKTSDFVVQQTIDIPRILVVPKGEVRSGFEPFTLALGALNYPAPSEELWVQYLRTGQAEALGVGKGSVEEARLEDYIVSGLVDFDDVAYDEHADLLYDLAGQTLQHFRRYLSEEDIRKVLRLHQKEIARFIHSQMQSRYWEEAVDYEVKISKGFTELKPSAYTASANEPPLNFRHSPSDKSNMAKYVFGGFTRCLYPMQKFQSDSERKLAVILEREASKWFRPAKGQFQIFYRWNGDHLEYQPDFVAETADNVYMLEVKARGEMNAPEVQAKKEAAVKWCSYATNHALKNGGKPWKYRLIPHDVIAENMTLLG